MKKLNFNTDRIIGLSAILISLLTLIIFIYQTNLIREQSRLSVTPRLSFVTSQDYKDSILNISQEVINKGLGPAIIESIEIVHQGKSYELDFGQFFKDIYPEIEEYGSLIQNMTMSKGSTLSAGESSRFYTYAIHPKKVQQLLNYLGVKKEELPFSIEVVYSSIYNERWQLSNEQDDHPRKLQ